jgi:tetratricopeptide (TPR) repeat protein
MNAITVPGISAEANQLISQGLTASQSNDSVSAIELFTQASQAEPQSGVPHFLIASEYAALGRIEEAETAFANAVLLAPGFAIARYQLGLLQFTSARASMALLTWEPLLQLPDSDPLPHFVRGFAELAGDQFDAALRHFNAGLELNTTNPALSNDIRMLIEKIEARPQAPGAALAATPAPSDDELEQKKADAHVLLANYQQRGLPH